MPERTILHCDMNNCYASIELISNPQWRGKPLAVCGSAEERRGIVLAKSEEAKKFGIKTGETLWQAKLKCPDLITVEPHYEEYLKYSRLARSIYYQYTDRVEPFGLDECWLDCTGSISLLGSGEKIAEEIRERIKNELGITVSIGVSFNKIFAKLGSDLKKPDAVSFIGRTDFRRKLWKLSASELFGVGRSTAEKLRRYGINTIGDLAGADPRLMMQILGKNGIQIWNHANGRDESDVMPAGYRAPVKSIGHGITCIMDLVNDEEVKLVFLELCQDVSRRLRDNQLKASGVMISVRDSSMACRQYQCMLKIPSQCSSEITRAASELFSKKYIWDAPVRALAISAINLMDEKTPYQQDLFSDHEKHEKLERAERAMHTLRKRYGKKSVTYASLIQDIKIPGERTDIVVLPTMAGRY